MKKALLLGTILAGLYVVPAAAQQTQCVTNALAGGTVDAIRIPTLPCGLATNVLILTLSGTNTVSGPTMQMAGGAVLPIKTATGADPGIGALSGAGSVVMLTGTGTQWRIVSGAAPAFTGTLTVPNGGTGRTTLTSNGLLVGAGTGAVVQTAAGTTGQVLYGNTGSPPTWGTPPATGVTSFSFGTSGLTPNSPTTGAVVAAGTLNVANGGTGVASATQYGMLYGNATAGFGVVAPGTTGQVLTANTGAAPTWSSLSAFGVSTIGFGTTGLTPSSATGGAVTVAGTLNVANGGTGATSLTNNGVVYGTGTTAVGTVAVGTTGQVLTANTGSPPTWTTLSTDVTTLSFGSTGLTPSTPTNGAVVVAGTLDVDNGGTGATSLANNGVLYGTGTTAVGVVAAGTTGQVLTATTGGAPTWAAPTASGVSSFSFGTTGLSPNTPTTGAVVATGVLNTANGGTGASSLSNNGVLYGTGAGAVGAVAAGTTGQVLTATTGSAPTWDSVVNSLSFGTTGLLPSSATTGAVTATGTLVAANGGTGNNVYVIGDLLYASTTTALTRRAAVASGQYLSSAGVGVAPNWSAALSLTGASLVLSGTAIPAGGTAGSGYMFSSTSNYGIFFGSGAPTLSAARGSIYQRSDGLPYYNTNGTTGWDQLTGLADIATITGTKTFSGTSGQLAAKLANAAEPALISATAATGTITYDVCTQSIVYYTSNASANWTVNLRCSSGTSLDTAMATGDVVTVTFLVKQGGTAYYNSAVQVDGSAVTPLYQGGTAWSAGNINSVDAYTYAITKTAAATFTVFASQVQFK